MTDTVQDIMSTNPVMLEVDASLRDAARCMRDEGIGDVVVADNGKVCGIVTDRDIVVRGLADDRDLDDIRLGDICSRQMLTVAADSELDEAVRLMREHAVRRLLVVDQQNSGQIAGVVSLGDLALKRDQSSVLGQISAAPPNM